ncbi:lysylphosphatidylglycerol synthase domain-containing protein [Desulfofustis glycolicus]|uniref:WD40-like Beta Propeller Repeat n=1 Tax=Desulfofustis glycolicus DSM 9705 TaxID=1121409 RepID=A0A1M5WIP9_9BACT|nr:lysylphosphatidylglycerol synthase domain-containing protein [Desulfofustis glycolicus]MCB2216832.1 flippase-like domain-containing protein [Desulfobulbaceae bacterium]SHH87288.1 WD40-like Beta Propeller Repeat [Desulfofustis glycolicus DSM 9705]
MTFFVSGGVRRFLPRLVLSCAVSVLLLGVLIHFSLSSAEPDVWARLLGVLSSFSLWFALLYVLLSLIRTVLQAQRYQVLLATTEVSVPSLFHLMLVTLSRNMFIDMLPARLGELTYIAMLNRGYRVSGQACISSLAICFVFDLIALGLLILLLIGGQLLGGELQLWLLGALVLLALLIMVLLVLLYPALAIVIRFLQRLSTGGIIDKLSGLLARIQKALGDTRRAGIIGRVLGLSLGIRLVKYLGMYCLFVGVVQTQFPDLTTRILMVLPALIGAEAGASLPVPAFMGFGTYEAAGMLALVALGATTATSLLVMLAMHLISQIIDYLLGTIGLLLFMFKSNVLPAVVGEAEGPSRPRWSMIVAALAVLLTGAVLFLAYEYRRIEKRGAIRAPEQGHSVALEVLPNLSSLQILDGFVVWSSNRSGSHDLYLFSLPDGGIRRLTSHPHTDYYPRISPDGTRIVFARSHEPWVSQRNVYAWDVWLLDLKTGRERRIAQHGNVPTWSADGTRVFFQRGATQVVGVTLATGEEQLLYQSGVTVEVPPKTELQTPDISSAGDRLAATFRVATRATAVVEPDGSVQRVGQGCQLSWGPGDRYLYKIDDSGRMGTSVHKIDAETMTASQWFDAHGDFSHEYFPRVAATGDVMVYGASAGGHEHDTADYEIFLWFIDRPTEETIRLSYHTGNDCWPDIFIRRQATLPAP